MQKPTLKNLNVTELTALKAQGFVEYDDGMFSLQGDTSVSYLDCWYERDTGTSGGKPSHQAATVVGNNRLVAPVPADVGETGWVIGSAIYRSTTTGINQIWFADTTTTVSATPLETLPTGGAALLSLPANTIGPPGMDGWQPGEELEIKTGDGRQLYVWNEIIPGTMVLQEVGYKSAATGDTALTIADDSVTNAKAANMAAVSVKSNPTNATADPADVALTADALLLERGGVLIAGKVRANRNVDFEANTVAGNGFDLSPPNPLIQSRDVAAGAITVTGQVANQTGIMAVVNTTAGDLAVTFSGDFVPVDGSAMPTTITANKRYVFSYWVNGTTIRVWPGGES